MRWTTATALGMTCAVCHLSDAAANTRASTMELDRLYQPPAILSVNRHPEYNVDGCRAIIFEGERFQDQPVSLFAYYAAPAGMAPIPSFMTAASVAIFNPVGALS